jgi:hypothetical protein
MDNAAERSTYWSDFEKLLALITVRFFIGEPAEAKGYDRVVRSPAVIPVRRSCFFALSNGIATPAARCGIAR